MNCIELRNVDYIFKGKKILTNINLQIKSGEFITITGHSGSGKSTVLRLLNNLISPTAGEILFKGQNITNYEPTLLRQKISLCFQMPNLFQTTVLENLAFPFLIRKKPVERKLIEQRLGMLNLSPDLLEKEAEKISGGEKQRIALIRSLLFTPEVLLLDEVTSALDEENTLAVEKLIEDLNQRGVTILWVTHNLEQTERLNTRKIKIEHGVLWEGE
ncbi:ATP-binding cassette domain-containing protein [Bacillota bacterium LX-D]|nr:ATP-binding cassette domain-containing protein [Bacillota bacterium LX-D]